MRLACCRQKLGPVRLQSPESRDKKAAAQSDLRGDIENLFVQLDVFLDDKSVRNQRRMRGLKDTFCILSVQ
jgi:hypothetical protein